MQKALRVAEGFASRTNWMFCTACNEARNVGFEDWSPMTGDCALDHCCRRGGSLRSETALVWRSLRTKRTQPTRREPGAGNHKFRPAAVEADPNVGRRGHGWMAQCTWAVAEETNFCRNQRQSCRLAFRANHGAPQETRTNAIPKSKFEGVTQSNRFKVLFSTARNWFVIESNITFSVMKSNLIIQIFCF